MSDLTITGEVKSGLGIMVNQYRCDICGKHSMRGGVAMRHLQDEHGQDKAAAQDSVLHAPQLRAFEVGATYSTRSVCDHDCVFSFTILKRSPKSVWVDVDGKVVRRAIEVWQGTETFYPFGKYSMAAIISAA